MHAKSQPVTVADQMRPGPQALARRRGYSAPSQTQKRRMAADTVVQSDQKMRKRRAKIVQKKQDAAVKALENEMKSYYVPPPIDQLPYNGNMARQYASSTNETEEQRTKRNQQALNSRISRHRQHFVHARIREERMRLENELLSMIAHVQMSQKMVECRVNEGLKTHGIRPIDFDVVWAEFERRQQEHNGDFTAATLAVRAETAAIQKKNHFMTSLNLHSS